YIVGDCPYRAHRQRRSEHLAVAVGDLAARGRQLQRARVTRLTLLLQKLGAHALQPERASDQGSECEEEEEQHETRTPGRQAHRPRGGRATRGRRAPAGGGRGGAGRGGAPGGAAPPPPPSPGGGGGPPPRRRQ